ncbi:GNAT family N-acetyltransferase [Nostoc sp. CENA67]|uniref:GNAT family N-acetyltransferase n=1 Tax=Amazonocrinis nigriterrae CENA67 TaxID=2794033 RepID=A0A8J7HUW0_9NOST|nr:GNAT family N-acetyltransferase [Amazonocrinis nigriterrae]MBH8566368.1 GNAT family N-acetyltransferase [Amazonocrinis nigriterrae CENA67]
MLTVSVATVTDIPALIPLLNSLFTQEAEFQPDVNKQTAGLQAIVTQPDVGAILVARDQDKFIGMVNILFTISTAQGGLVAILEDMVVDTDYRGAGIGSALITQAIAFCQSKGVSRITLLTDADNYSAIHFYEKHGFAKSPMIPLRRFI